MSQVVVTDDSLKQRRLRSGEQERQIDREGQFKKWLKSDITGFDPIAALVGLAVLPVVAVWYLIGFLMKFSIYIGIGFSRLLGSLLSSWSK
jgi:hypothetical protein